MPYKTVQCNFSMGEAAPAIEGRADTEFYQKTARRMRDVAIDAFGGFRRRPGTRLVCVPGIAMATDRFTKTAQAETITEDGQTLLQFTHVNVPCQAVETVPYYSSTLYENCYAYMVPVGKYYIEDIDPSYNIYSAAQTPELGTELFNGSPNGPSLGIVVAIENVTFWEGIPLGWRKYTLSSGLIIGKAYKDTPPATWAFSGEYGNVYTPMERTGAGAAIQLNISAFSLSAGSGGSPYLQITAEKYEYAQDPTPAPAAITNTITTDIRTVPLVPGAAQDVRATLGSTEASRITVKIYGYSGAVSLAGATIATSAAESRAYRLIPFVLSNSASYMIAMKVGYITILKNGQEVQTLEAPFITAENAASIRYAQNAGTMIFTHRSFAPRRLVIGTADDGWTLDAPAFDMPYMLDGLEEEWEAVAANVTASAMDGAIRLTFSTAIARDLTGQYFEGDGARVKITKHSAGATTAEGYTLWGFYTDHASSAITNSRCTTNYVPAWSTDNGWPAAVTFFQGRMWLAGTSKQPQTVWGSRSGLYYRFMPADSGNADAIEYTIDTDSLSRISALYPMDGIYVLTESGIFLTSASYDQPLTPETVNAKKISSIGASADILPLDIDGRITFIERTGSAIMTLAPGTQGNIPANSSIIARHIINSPADMDAEHVNRNTQCNYLYITNGDGTLAVCNMLAEQTINGGFTLWDFGGKCLSVCVLPEGTYLLMERNGLQTIEKLDWDCGTDCTLTFTAQQGGRTYANTYIAPPSQDAGPVSADIFINGKYSHTAKLAAGGQATLPEPAAGTVQIGRAFRPYVESHPLEIPQLAQGMGRRKRIAGFTARVLDTPSLVINGMERSGTGHGAEDLEYSANAGWGKAETYSITQNDGRPMHVLACQITANFEVSGDEY